ncbi:hypothetical protein B0H13DRAFT_1853839 [Mycena leptocephala]|nr:hypothetical protein B0H13DRAFT_1853839 [Mycena leptocephala]
MKPSEINRPGQETLLGNAKVAEHAASKVSGTMRNSAGYCERFCCKNSPHANIHKDDFGSVIPPSQAADPAVELYPSGDEDEGLEYMKSTEHPPNECNHSGIDDILELPPGDSPPGVNEFVADPDWEPPESDANTVFMSGYLLTIAANL